VVAEFGVVVEVEATAVTILSQLLPMSHLLSHLLLQLPSLLHLLSLMHLLQSLIQLLPSSMHLLGGLGN
jgi:hypothetical protein